MRRKFINGFSLWLWWILASVFGIGLGYAAAYILFSLYKLVITGPPQLSFVYFIFPIAGLSVGFTQWLAIRKYLPRAKIWILALLISYSTSVAIWYIFEFSYVLFPIFWHDYGDVFWLPSALLAGVPLWLMLHRRFSKSGVWALVGSIGLLYFFWAMFSTGYDLYYFSGYDVVGGLFGIPFFSGVPSGIFSGLLIAGLLRQFLSDDPFIDLRPRSVHRFDGVDGADQRSALQRLYGRAIFVNIGFPILVSVACLIVLMLTGPYFPSYSENTGLETTPQEYSEARMLWEGRPFSRYRLVAGYYTVIDSCWADVEVQDEQIVAVYEAECEGLSPRTVSGFFDLMERYVGKEAERQPVGNGCSFYYVDAVFDAELGYPHYMRSETILNISERNQYSTTDRTFSCLLFGPVQYTVKIESVTPLP
jgi:hypothetical protein